MSDFDGRPTGSDSHGHFGHRPFGPHGRHPGEMPSWWSERNIAQRILIVLGFAVLGLGLVALLGWVVMLLWNWLMPDLFGLKTINFWQAGGLFVLSTLLFKGMGGGNKGGGPDRRRREHLRRYLRAQAENNSPPEGPNGPVSM